MFFFLTGALLLFLLLSLANGLSRARLTALKMLLAWLGAAVGLAVVLFFVLTGRIGAVLPAFILFGPLLWQRVVRAPKPAATGRMSRQEALDVLGLGPDPTEAEIREAWLRVMRGAHPDNGGSDWLAARVNMARDVLLGRR